MSEIFRKDDLRVIKTRKVLKHTLLQLLRTRSFKQITVNDICVEALTSRAAFYSHFCDKYSLLKVMLTDLLSDYFCKMELNDLINKYIYGKNRYLKNLLDDADDETLEILRDMTMSILENVTEVRCSKSDPEYLILSNLCAGGIIQVVNWQIKNFYPQGIKCTKKYFHDVVKSIAEMNFESGEDI